MGGGLGAGLPPLTDEQRTRLATAYDGRDHREEAFVALLENARAVAGLEPHDQPGPEPAPPDVDALMASPGEHRGELCRIAGVIQQKSPLPWPYEEVREWWLRAGSGPPVVVYVVGMTAEEEVPFKIGRRVSIIARFYKRTTSLARDGRTRDYAAFVGAHPRLPGGRGDVTSSLPVIFALVGLGAGGGLLVLLLVLAARRSRGPASMRTVATGDPRGLDAEAPLPDDPSEALAELRRRAEAEE